MKYRKFSRPAGGGATRILGAILLVLGVVNLAALHEEYAAQGFQVVGVCGDIVDPTGALDDALHQKALELEKETGADVYCDLNPAGDIMQNFIDVYISAFPSSLFVNSKGDQVGNMIIGACSKERWAQEIESRLALVHGDAAS